MVRIYISDVEGKPAVCFNTGFDPRSFARTKMSQSLIEPGYVVYPDGSHEVWKSSGVGEVNGSMRVWGPVFSGERLDSLLNRENPTDQQRTTALQAVVYWIRAKMLLGDTNSALNSGAAFVCLEDGKSHPKGSVFFAPRNLSNRCLIAEGIETDFFNCPDLTGMDAAAFCAGAMLYRILARIYPYPHHKTIYQDMREGLFLPPRLAIPGLNEKLCNLIQASFLLPIEKRKSTMTGTDIVGGFLNLLMENNAQIVSISSLLKKLPKEEYERLDKTRKSFLFRQNTHTKIKRFAIANKHALIGTTIGLLFFLFVFLSTQSSLKDRPTTAGMSPDTVIMVYYDAFSSLDHMLMEACIRGADKTDVNVAVSFYAVDRTRQSYGSMASDNFLVPARVWRDSGEELPSSRAFGVTDLSLDFLSGSYDDNIMIYRADYLLWSPDISYSIKRSDTLTLRQDRMKNWRITEILRIEG